MTPRLLDILYSDLFWIAMVFSSIIRSCSRSWWMEGYMTVWRGGRVEISRSNVYVGDLGLLTGSQVGVVFEQYQVCRTAARCAPESSPVTVSCRITERRPGRESAKHSDVTAPVTAYAVAKAGKSERMRGSSKRSLQRRPCFRK